MTTPSKPNIYPQPLVEYDRITFWWLTDGESEYVLECVSPPFTKTYDPTTSEAFVTNLSPFTQYSFTLKATNIYGESELAFFDTVTTGYRPDPPTALTATEEFYTTGTTIQWTPPIYEGGSPVFDYVITANAYNQSNIHVPEKDFFLSTEFPTSTSLFPLETYDYKVTVQAINSCGYSAMSVPLWIYNLDHPGSLYFNGTSNYCAVTDATNPSPFALSTTDFTVECFFKITSLTNTPYLFSCATSSFAEAFSLQLQNTGSEYQFVLKYPSTSGIEVEAFGTEEDFNNGWHHIALVGETILTNRVINVYLDGLLYHTTTSYSFTETILDLTIGQRSTPSSTCNFQGYITNLRFVSGLALYISNFVIPSIPLGVIGGTGIQTEVLLQVENDGTQLQDSSGFHRVVSDFGIDFSVQHP